MNIIAGVKTNYTQEQIDDLICSAFEVGISYWADRIEVEDYKTAQYGHEVLTRGGSVIVVDDEGGKHELTLKKVVEAIGKEGIDFDNYDAGDADNVVQRALFGEVIYG
jgi:hypothetical protein